VEFELWTVTFAGVTAHLDGVGTRYEVPLVGYRAAYFEAVGEVAARGSYRTDASSDGRIFSTGTGASTVEIECCKGRRKVKVKVASGVTIAI